MRTSRQIWPLVVQLCFACLLLSLNFNISADEAHKEVHWSYEGATGPAHWGEFFPECGQGKSQSPVDIRGPFATTSDSISVNYKPSVLKMINNGHTIQINYDAGSSITVHNQQYDLVQFHFHKPSEEQIDDHPKAMVIHFVHKSAEGKLAVIGVLVNEGKANELIQTLWSNLPKKVGEEKTVQTVSLDASKLFPPNLSFYHFSGSLTTPPCTEGVDFYILKNPIEMSKEQIAAFPFRTNARPVQPLNGRQIDESTAKQ